MATPAEFKAQLMNDMKEAMKAKEKVRLTSVKAIQAAIKQKEIDEQKEITEEGVVAVMNKLVKQRKESVLSYTNGNRLDLAVAEQAECDVIYSYLPKQLTTEEVGKMITEAIAKVAATNIKDMGKVMAELKPQLMGKADMTSVGNLIRQQLGGPVGKK
eukprot:gene14193-16318_t